MGRKGAMELGIEGPPGAGEKGGPGARDHRGKIV